MGLWKLVRPKANTNLITNPSFEIDTTGHSDSGSNTIARSSEQSSNGGYSLKCTYQDNLTLNNYDISLDAGTYLFYARVYIPSNWDGGGISISQVSLTGTSTTLSGDITSTGGWYEVAILHVMAGTDIGSITIGTGEAPTAGRYIYVDCMMVTTASRLETYIDGDMPGCYWNGTPHASTATRSQFDRRGGEILDLETDLYFNVHRAIGVGMVSSKNLSQPISNQGGASYDGNQTQPRNFALIGSFNAGNVGTSSTGRSTYHSRKRALLKALNPKTNTDVDDTPLPVLILYTGGDATKEIGAYYEGGLEDSWDAPHADNKRVIRFLAVDPFFYDISRPATVLTTTDSATFRMMARRIGAVQNITSDVWDNMGVSAVTSGTAVYAIAEDDTYIYIGGEFLNYDGTAASDNIARWHKADRVWSALSSGANGGVRALLVVGSYLYAGGAFDTAGGTTCRGIARWDGSTWAALGPPSSGGGVGSEVHSIAADPSGNIYVGGDFVNFDGIANADHVAKWNGSAWSALSTGIDNSVYDIKWYDSYLYAVGAYTTAGGVAADSIARWNGSAWAAISTAVIAGSITQIVFEPGGNFYIGGGFSSIDSDTNLKEVAYWNGQGYVSLDGGTSGGVAWNLSLDDDGFLYAGGTFTSAGTLSTLGDSLAKWNGSS